MGPTLWNPTLMGLTSRTCWHPLCPTLLVHWVPHSWPRTLGPTPLMSHALSVTLVVPLGPCHSWSHTLGPLTGFRVTHRVRRHSCEGPTGSHMCQSHSIGPSPLWAREALMVPQGPSHVWWFHSLTESEPRLVLLSSSHTRFVLHPWSYFGIRFRILGLILLIHAHTQAAALVQPWGNWWSWM